MGNCCAKEPELASLPPEGDIEDVLPPPSTGSNPLEDTGGAREHSPSSAGRRTPSNGALVDMATSISSQESGNVVGWRKTATQGQMELSVSTFNSSTGVPNATTISPVPSADYASPQNRNLDNVATMHPHTTSSADELKD